MPWYTLGVELYISAWVFGLGAIIGSFLNVVVCRFNTGRSIAGGRSCCFSCGTRLKAVELIPIVSYCVQNGRCRSCKSKFSSQYAVVELLTGIIFTLVWLKLGLSSGIAGLLFWWVVWSLFIVISAYDIRHTIIPDAFAGALGVIALGSLAVRGGDLLSFMMGILFFVLFFAIWLISRGKAMGLGDAKLAVSIGWLFSPAMAFSALLVSFWYGALIGIILMGLKRPGWSLKTEIPFGPFLALGAFTVFLFDLVLI